MGLKVAVGRARAFPPRNPLSRSLFFPGKGEITPGQRSELLLAEGFEIRPRAAGCPPLC